MLAPQPQDPNTGSLPRRVTNMASRFIARQSRSKVLPLRNAMPIVTFTFDDVPASACEQGAHILERHGARGLFTSPAAVAAQRIRMDRCVRRSINSGPCGQMGMRSDATRIPIPRSGA